MKDSMKKVAFFALILTVGQLRAQEFNGDLAALDVSLSQLWQPNAKIFYNSSKEELQKTITDIFNKVKNVFGIEKLSPLKEDSGSQEPTIYSMKSMEVVSEDKKATDINEANAQKDMLQKVLDSYNALYTAYEKIDDTLEKSPYAFEAQNLIKVLGDVESKITVKVVVEPPVWGNITNAASAKTVLTTIKDGMGNVDQAAADGYYERFDAASGTILDSFDDNLYILAKEVATALSNEASTDYKEKYTKLAGVFN